MIVVLWLNSLGEYVVEDKKICTKCGEKMIGPEEHDGKTCECLSQIKSPHLYYTCTCGIGGFMYLLVFSDDDEEILKLRGRYA